MFSEINQQDVAHLPTHPDEIGSGQTQIIPAAPNTFALLHKSLGICVIESQTFCRVPILAWSINELRDPHPILLDGKVPENAYFLGLCAYQIEGKVKFWNKPLMIGSSEILNISIANKFEENHKRYQEIRSRAHPQTVSKK